MSIGTMRDRITFVQRSTGQDAIGQPVSTVSDVASVWADVRFKNGKEFISSDRETSSVQASCRIRQREVSSAWMVRLNGSLYEITAVLPQGRFIDLVINRVV